ncbi:sulfurtransferase complex subunit TusB [Pseudomonas sp. Marseille-QA0892]
MATLHMLSHAPTSNSDFSSCLRLLAENDGLLLCGDAVYALQPGTDPARTIAALGDRNSVFAMDEDVSARGIEPVAATIRLLDYPGFVEICTRYDRVNSWL